MKYALVKDNIVEGVIVYDGVAPYVPAEGLSLVQVNDWVSKGDDISVPAPIPDAPKSDVELKAMDVEVKKADASFVASYQTELKSNPNLTFEDYVDFIDSKVQKPKQ